MVIAFCAQTQSLSWRPSPGVAQTAPTLLEDPAIARRAACNLKRARHPQTADRVRRAQRRVTVPEAESHYLRDLRISERTRRRYQSIVSDLAAHIGSSLDELLSSLRDECRPL